MIRAELTDARQTINDLEKGKTNVNGELMKRDDLMKALQEQLQNLRTSDYAQKEEIQSLKVSLADATEREENLLSDIERKQSQVTEDDTKLKGEIDRLTSALQKAETDKEALEKSLTQALETSYEKYKALRFEKENIEKELVSVKTQKQKHSPTSVVVVERNNELEAEVTSLKSSLSKMTAKCNELRAERSNLSKKLSQYKKDEGTTPRDDRAPQPKVFTFNENNNESEKNEDELIPNRLERIRDAAERAALAQEHRRDLSRLKMEHEKEMKVVSERHEQDIRDVFEEAKAEVTARSRELRRHLQNEYETKIVTLERRYQSDLARVCKRTCSFITAKYYFLRFGTHAFLFSYFFE
jgi:chorismate mutase